MVAYEVSPTVDAPRPRRNPVRRERRAVAAAVLAVLALTALVLWVVRGAELRDERSKLEEAGTSLAASVVAELQRMADLGLDVGVATARMETLDADTYEALLDDLAVEDRFLGLTGVSFVSHVPRERLDDFLDERTAEGDGFALADDAGEDRLRIVTYVYPRTTNLAALGADLTSRSDSRSAADRAVERDEPALSPFTEIIQHDAAQPGVSLHAPARDAEGRLIGTIGVVVALDDFLQYLEPLPGNVEVRLIDPADDDLPDGVAIGETASQAAQSITVPVETAGQRWQLQVSALPGFSPPWSQRGSTYLGLGGLVIAAMVGLLVRSAVSRERLSAELVQARTAQLSEVNEQLASTNRALADASRTKDEFLASVSHELRTPLTVISGFVESIERMHGHQPGIADLLDPIQRNVRRLDGLVSDLLTLASLDAGAITPMRSSLELSAVLRSAARELAGLEDDEVHLSIEPDLRVAVDPRHLERVLTNLLVNAVRHGSPPVEIAAWRSDADTVAFSVRDHGPGIDERDVDAVFDRFARGSGSESTTGTGLGLAIVQELIDLNGGSVDYEDAQPGARFTIRLLTPPPGATVIEPETSDQAAI